MKWICMLLSLAVLCSPAVAQDAATQERLDKLSGQIEDLIAAQKSQQKQISELIREIDRVREQTSRPNEAYASQEDLKRLADTVKEVDRKRLDDAERVHKELLNLSKTLTAVPARKPSREVGAPSTDKPAGPERFFEHTVGKGDTLSTIVEAFREQKVKVTVDQILKANPGLKPEKMAVGQKIIIPAP
ncbi:MAG TPA: LysM peptidoglycan-binding domain-containing protein [Clostridia bacterium]|nr:LysM peptidoglycan-binding domain-containing protein [Clostridia bacterium]